MAAGNRHLGYKEVLNALEDRSPGIEGRVPLRLPRARPRALRRRRRRRARRAGGVPRVRRAHPGRRLRVLPAAFAGRRDPAARRRRRRPADVARAFAAGDRVLLVDAKRRRHLVTLADGGEFHTHAGVLAHDDIIGQPDGVTVRTTRNARLVAVRPTLAEYVLEMPRGAQVIYPKDLGPILILADVFPGARVLESGVGSGALTLALLRAVGPHRPRHRLRDPRRLRPARPQQRRGLPRPRHPARHRGARRLRRHRRRRPRPHPARPPRAVAGREARRSGAAPRRDPARLPARPSGRCRACARSWRARRSAWSSRSRCCSAPGTSTASRCAPTTAWSRTPGSSPTRGCSRRGRELPRPRRRSRSPWARAGSATAWGSCGGSRRGPVSRSASSSRSLFVADVADALRGSPPRTRLLASLAFVLVVATVAQAVGRRDRQLAARAPRSPRRRRAAPGRSRRRRRGRCRRRARGHVAAHPRARELAGLDGPRGARQRGRARHRPASRRAAVGVRDPRPPGRRPVVPRGVRHAHVTRRGHAARRRHPRRAPPAASPVRP